jgi:signal peptidase I
MNNNKEVSAKTNVSKQVKEYGISILIAIGLAFVLHSYVFARATVDGPSMQPTFHTNDVVFLDKLSVETGNIKRGEIVVFNSRDENNDDYIKRVIGVAGDEVKIMNGKVYVNGKELNESYLAPGTITEPITPRTTYKVPAGDIFVLGDNRTNSTDSRILGFIKLKDVKGRVVFRAYPFNEIRTF